MKKINRCGEEESLFLHMKTEEELAEKVPICVMTKEVIRKPTMVIKEMLVPELIEAPGGEVAQDDVMQEVVDENQTDLDQLMAVSYTHLDVYKRQQPGDFRAYCANG